MLPEDAPKCYCGSKNWASGGGSFGGITQSYFTCNDCSRPAMELGASGCSAFIQATAWPTADGKGPGDLNAFLPYINDVLLVAFRVHGDKVKATQDILTQKAWVGLCDEINMPAEIRQAGCEQRWDDVHRLFDVPTKELWYVACDKARSTEHFRHPIDTPLPPQVPDGLYIRLWRPEWMPVVNALTKDIPIPPDPIRVRHDAYWLPIFPQLGITHYQETENVYCGAKNEPWYTFTIFGADFVVGPRKRVDAIEVDFHRIVSVSKIRDIAKADDTTYYADEDWKSESDQVERVSVHAWTKEKLLEYLTVLIEEARG